MFPSFSVGLLGVNGSDRLGSVAAWASRQAVRHAAAPGPGRHGMYSLPVLQTIIINHRNTCRRQVPSVQINEVEAAKLYNVLDSVLHSPSMGGNPGLGWSYYGGGGTLYVDACGFQETSHIVLPVLLLCLSVQRPRLQAVRMHDLPAGGWL